MKTSAYPWISVSAAGPLRVSWTCPGHRWQTVIGWDERRLGRETSKIEVLWEEGGPVKTKVVRVERKMWFRLFRSCVCVLRYSCINIPQKMTPYYVDWWFKCLISVWLNTDKLMPHLFACHRNGAARRELHCWHGDPSGSWGGKCGPNSLRNEDTPELLRCRAERGRERIDKTGQ